MKVASATDETKPTTDSKNAEYQRLMIRFPL
jgi:hypothetical protein